MTVSPPARRDQRSAAATRADGSSRVAAARELSGTVKSARRVLEILELLGSKVDGLTFPQIVEQLELPKSSLHALLGTMVGMGWLAFDDGARTYRIGVRAWEVGQGYVRARDLALIADPHLRAVREELNETVQLGVLDDVDVLYIAKVESDRPFRLVSRVGMRLPAWATGLGKVLLASLPADELRQRMAKIKFVRFTETTVRDMDQLELVLERIRAEGIGRDEGEYTAFVYCVAVPVRDQSGAVVAAMSCTLPEPPHRRPGGEDHLAEVMRRHGAELSKSLGWNPPAWPSGGKTIDV